MADDFLTPTIPEEQVTDFLGSRSPLAFRGTPALPVTGAAAVGAPQGPVGLAGGLRVGGGAASPQTGGGQPSPDIAGIVNLALRGGLKFADLASIAFGSGPAGATETSSGQLTTSAPEILRGQQFPEGTGSGEIPGPSIPSGEGGGFDLGGLVGPALGSASSIYGIINALRSGNYPGLVAPAASLGTTAASQAGLIPAELTALTGAGIPFAAATGILTGIIQDMIADPGGSKSAVQDFNNIMSRTVPGEAQGLQLGAAMLPLISDRLTNDQAIQLYQAARTAVKDSELLADPLSRQGKSKAGVDYADYPGLNEAVSSLAPNAILATLRLQDLLASRGVDVTPFEGPNVSPEAVEIQRFRELDAAQNPESSFAGMPSLFSPEGFLAPLGPLTPAEALGKIGHYGGYEGTQPGYTYDPATTAMLEGIKPGGLETGLRSYLEGTPGFAGSPMAALWAAGGMEGSGAGQGAAGGPPVTAQDIQAAFSPTAMTPGGGGMLPLEELMA